MKSFRFIPTAQTSLSAGVANGAAIDRAARDVRPLPLVAGLQLATHDTGRIVLGGGFRLPAVRKAR